MSSGRIVQIIGAVIDVEFNREDVPKVYDALTVTQSGTTLEVQQQLGDGVVRAIAMGVSDGLSRGLEVVNTLTVGQRLRVTGEATFEGDLTARQGAFSDVVVSDSGDVTDEIQALTLDVAGEVTADTVRATVAMTAPDVTATDVNASNVVAEDVRSDDIVAREVRAHLVRGSTVRGDKGVYRHVYTGGCSGC